MDFSIPGFEIVKNLRSSFVLNSIDDILSLDFVVDSEDNSRFLVTRWTYEGADCEGKVKILANVSLRAHGVELFERFRNEIEEAV